MRDNLVMLLQLALFAAGFFVPTLCGRWWSRQAPDLGPEAVPAMERSGQFVGVFLALALWAFDFWVVPRIFY